MRIAYLNGESFAVSSCEPALCEEFNSCNVKSITAKDLNPAGLKDVDVLMLPGITGEKSPYPDILPPNKAQAIYNMMENDGLIVIAECAAFYWSAEEIFYDASNGDKLHRQGLGWIKGIAKGPSGKGLAPHKDFKYADTITAPIEFYEGGKTHYTQICVSNGPALYLTGSEAENPDVKITSRFIAEEGYPVATMTKVIGHGLLVGMGVLPHIKTMQLGGHNKNPGHERHRVELFNTIANHEVSINRFEKLIFNQIRTHNSNLQQTRIPRVA